MTKETTNTIPSNYIPGQDPLDDYIAEQLKAAADSIPLSDDVKCRVEQKLSDPKNKTYYEKNLKSYTDKLSKLDQEAKETFNKIPDEKKLIVTSEGCFKYFSKAYGVPSAYIWEINTEEEGTPDQIKTLVEKLRQTKVPALFVESSVDERPMKTVSKDTNIPIYAKIFTDSIAEKGQDGDSYYNMMKYNLDKITQGLNQ